MAAIAADIEIASARNARLEYACDRSIAQMGFCRIASVRGCRHEGSIGRLNAVVFMALKETRVTITAER